MALGLYTRWLHRGGLIAGWAAGMGLGMWMLYQIPNAATKRAHFGGSAFPLAKFGFDTPKTIYVGFVAVLVNLLVAVIVTFILRAMKTPDGVGRHRRPDDYFADEDDPRLEKARRPRTTSSASVHLSGRPDGRGLRTAASGAAASQRTRP